MDAWEFAHREWVKYGNREIRTSRDFYIRLYEAEELEAEARSLRQKIADLVPGLENELAKKNRDELSDEQLLAWDTSIDKRTPEQHEIGRETRFDIQVTPRDIANAAPESTQSQIRYLATEIEDYEQRADFVRRYRQIVNYEYWKTRCEVEQLDEANAARKHLYQADKDFREGRLEPAKKEYNPSFFENLIHKISKAAKVTVLEISKYKFEPQGFTILALLAESHISFHTFPEKGITSFDFFTCGKVSPSIACLLYTSPSPRDLSTSRMPSSA